METEPALTVTAITTLVAAVIGLLVAFGVPVSADQKEAILGVVLAGWAVGTPLWIRAKVFSPATHEREVDDAVVEALDVAA
jgi:hypothetical protein